MDKLRREVAREEYHSREEQSFTATRFIVRYYIEYTS